MGDVFQTYLLRTQYQKTLELLQESFPENANIQQNVNQLVSKKKLWKEKLELMWQNRRRPLFTQWDIRTMNYELCLQVKSDPGGGTLGGPKYVQWPWSE